MSCACAHSTSTAQPQRYRRWHPSPDRLAAVPLTPLPATPTWRTLIAAKKTREKGVRVLLYADQLAPQLIHHDVFAREAVADLLRQARREAGGRELRGLAWRRGVTPIG
jgi:hypothetical protein